MKNALFSFEGRIARLPYLGWTLGAYVLFALAIFFGAAVMGGNATLNPAGAIFAAILFVIAFIALIWAMAALTIKRLHDLGMAGTHYIWILLLGMAGNATAVVAPGLSVILGIASLGVALWLIFAPGNSGDNAYGPAPV